MIAPVPADPDQPRHSGHLFLKNIPRTTKKAFKSEVADCDLYMRDALIILMRRFVTARRKGLNVIRIDAMRKNETEDIDE